MADTPLAPTSQPIVYCRRFRMVWKSKNSLKIERKDEAKKGREPLTKEGKNT